MLSTSVNRRAAINEAPMSATKEAPASYLAGEVAGIAIEGKMARHAERM